MRPGSRTTGTIVGPRPRCTPAWAPGLALLVLCTAGAVAAQDSAGSALYRVRENHKWGFVSREGRMIIPPTFDGVADFSEGRAAANGPGEKWGFIDPQGAWVIPARFDDARAFSAGLAPVRIDKLWTYVAANCQLMAPPYLDRAGRFVNGRALNCQSVTGEGKVASGCYYITPRGIPAFKAVFWDAADFSDGLASVRRKGGLWFVIDTAGNEVIPPGCLTREVYFHDGRALVRYFVGDPGSRQYLCRYLDRTGRAAIPGPYACEYVWEVSEFHEGLATVRTVVIDTTGTTVLDLGEDSPYSGEGFRRGLLLVCRYPHGTETCRLVDRLGNVVWKARY